MVRLRLREKKNKSGKVLLNCHGDMPPLYFKLGRQLFGRHIDGEPRIPLSDNRIIKCTIGTAARFVANASRSFL